MPITSTDLLAKLTAAVMADAALSEQVRAYEEDTFESFLGWLRTEGIEVVIHGKYGPPIRSYLFMGSHGTHLYHRPWFEYPALSLMPIKRVPHRRFATGDTDLRFVDDIRRGRSTTNSIRTQKYIETEDDLRGPLLISLVSPDGTLDIDILDQTDRLRFMTGLTTLVLPSLTAFGLPEGMRRQESQAKSTRRKGVVSATERFSAPPSDIRATVYKLMYNPWMDKFILSCIVISTITMAMNGISAQENDQMVSSLFIIEWIVSSVFILEAGLRMVAMEGFLPYWKDPWNRLDFIIVVLGIITELPFVANLKFSAFRAFRALRALRTMKYAHGLRQIVDTFIETYRGVVNVLFVYGYFVFLFSALGVDLFQKRLSGRCMVLLSGGIEEPRAASMSNSGSSSTRIINSTAIGKTTTPLGSTTTLLNGTVNNITAVPSAIYAVASPEQFCMPSSTAQMCAQNQVCQDYGNPGSGFTTFDSFGPAVLTVVRFAGRAPGISTPLRALMRTASPLSMLFFIAISIFISCLVMALFIAVVRLSFIAVRQNRKKQAIALADAKQEARESRERMDSARKKKIAEAEAELRKKRGLPEPEEQALDVADGEKKSEGQETSDSRSSESALRGEEEGGGEDDKEVGQGKRDGSRTKVCFCLDAEGVFVRKIGDIILHSRSITFINWCILLNCVFLAMEHYKMSSTFDVILRIGEIFFTAIFLLEMILKIIGLKGVRVYLLFHEDWAWNQFDCVIVCMTCLDLLLQEVANGLIPLSLLRIFRLGRIMRMLRNVEDLMKIVYAILNSISAMVNLLLFVFLIIILFAILGMQLFGGHFEKKLTWVNGSLELLPPRSNFDEFGPAMMTLFRMITGGGGTWGITFNALKTQSAWAAPPYFFGFTVFGVFITLNYLVVIIMGQFAMKPEQKDKLRKSRELMMRKRAKTRISRTSSVTKDESNLALTDGSGIATGHNLASKGAMLARRQPQTAFERLFVPRLISPQRAEMSLLCISQSNPVRMLMKKIVSSWTFEAGIIGAIVVSSVTLTLESPLYTDETLKQVLQVCDVFFLVVFSVEAIMKVIALGFILPYDSYLSDAWNKLDFVVLIVTFAGMAGSSSGIGRTLRVGRILRPLRMINRWEGMRVIVDALLRSLPAVGYTVILLAVYLFLFAVLGLTIFLGRFYRCNDPSIVSRDQCRGTFENNAGVIAPRVWANPPYSFDNIFAGMLTLCSVITRRAWLDVMYSGMDVTKEGYQPVRDASPHNALYFVIFMFVGAFFMLKIFVGIIVGTFRQFSGTALLTPEQITWLATKRMMRRVRVKRPPSTTCAGRVAHNVVSNRFFEGFITCCILVHILFMATQNPAQHETHTYILRIVHWVVTGIYILEIAFRVVASGIFRFFCRSENMFWNFFDTCVVAIMLIVPLITGSYAGVGVARALQFGRVTRLLRYFKGIEHLFEVLTLSLPAMLNVVVLFLLMLFVFAVLGMQLFGSVRNGPQLAELADFKTFPQALLTLFQVVAGGELLDALSFPCALNHDVLCILILISNNTRISPMFATPTIENWIPIMRDCSVEAPACMPVSIDNPLTSAWHSSGDCGSGAAAGLYFFGFFVMVFCESLLRFCFRYFELFWLVKLFVSNHYLGCADEIFFNVFSCVPFLAPCVF